MNTIKSHSVQELWTVITKEITGIQVLCTTVNDWYFRVRGKEFHSLENDMPLLFGLIQTALMESLLMRVSRLMDPANSGKNEGDRPNLSLQRLVNTESALSDDAVAIRKIWDNSRLKSVRDKYLSHNDLDRAMKINHTLNIPLESEDIDALRTLAEGLRELRRNVNGKLMGCAYIDQGLDANVRCELDILERSLVGSELFFSLLPDHVSLQQAWQKANESQGGKPC